MAIDGALPALRLFGDDYPTPDGTCVRDYVHVCDLAVAHILAMEKLLGDTPDIVANLGSGSGLSVRAILDAAKDVTGHCVPCVMAPRRPGDPPRLIADPGHARAVLGWSAQQSSAHSILASAWAWRQKDRANQ
jgi:UDP-glucose 4-epimerase